MQQLYVLLSEARGLLDVFVKLRRFDKISASCTQRVGPFRKVCEFTVLRRIRLGEAY